MPGDDRRRREDPARRDAMLKEMRPETGTNPPETAATARCSSNRFSTRVGRSRSTSRVSDRLIESIPEDGKGDACFFVGWSGIAAIRGARGAFQVFAMAATRSSGTAISPTRRSSGSAGTESLSREEA